MTLKLKFIGGTALARHYEHANGTRQWVPRRVCRVRVEGNPHEVEIEDWWLQQNPFERKESKGQTSFL